MVSKSHCVIEILKFLDQKKLVDLQITSKRFYESFVPWSLLQAQIYTPFVKDMRTFLNRPYLNNPPTGYPNVAEILMINQNPYCLSIQLPKVDFNHNVEC